MEKTLFFTTEEYQQRLENVRKGMREKGVDVLIVHTPENIYYMSGFQSMGYYVYGCLVIPLEKEPYWVGRHLEEFNWLRLSWMQNYVCFKDIEDPVEVTVKSLEKFGLKDKVIGLETENWFLTSDNYIKFKEALPNAVPCNGVIEKCRVIKSPTEIKYIREAARITEKAMTAGINAVKVGATEDDVAAVVNYTFTKEGSEWISMGPFVCAGERASLAHATWEGKVIEAGTNVWFEIAGVKHRYNCALERVVFTGEKGNEEMIKLTEIIMKALYYAIGEVKPGMTASEADYTCRHIINEETGLGNFYRHRFGYSIGISFSPDWGEGHILSLRDGVQDILQPGMVFHVPPAIIGYRDRAVGCSETILITETGCEAITNYPSKIFIAE